MINPVTGRRRVLVLDLEGRWPVNVEGLVEMLGCLAEWEADDQEPLRLPAPIAGGRALRAVERVNRALLAAVGEQAQAAGATGTQSSRVIDRTWGTPGSLNELAPLRLAEVDQDDVETLTALDRVLSADRVPADIETAAEHAAEYTAPAAGVARGAAGVYRAATQLADLLTLPWDDHVRALVVVLADLAPGADLELSAAQAAAYRTAARQIMRVTGGDGLDLFAAGAFE